MKRTTFVRWVAAVVSLLIYDGRSTLAYQERPRDTPPATGSSSIVGRVVSGSGGAAVGEAVVTAVETASGLTKSVATGDSGAFELRGLPAGRYVLSATKATFISGRYGQSSPGESRRVLVLADGKTESGVEIRLWKAGVVSGRILTQSAEPLPGATVNLMRLIVDGEIRRLMPIRASAVSSDTGEYRVFGIDPGEYFLVATPPPIGYRMGLDVKKGPRPTFFPSGVAPEAAQPLTVVAEGALAADVFVQTGHFVRVDGTILDSTVRTGITVRAAAPGLALEPQTIASQGRFSFPSLPEGAYTFYSDPVRDSAGRVTVFFTEAQVHAQSQQPTAVALRPIRASVVSGTVRLPPDVTLNGPPAVTVGAQPRFDSRVLGPSPSVSTDKESRFSFMAWPGPNGIHATVRTPGLYVKAIRLNGIDVTDEGISVRDGTNVDGVDIELTRTTQTLSGSVAKSPKSNEVLEDLAVVVFPTDRQLWRSIRRTSLARVDKNGEFTLKAIPPGTYAAAVVSAGVMFNVRDPRLLEPLLDTAKVITLSSGETATVALRR